MPQGFTKLGVTCVTKNMIDIVRYVHHYDPHMAFFKLSNCINIVSNLLKQQATCDQYRESVTEIWCKKIKTH